MTTATEEPRQRARDDRTPPHDAAAETAVLGCMMLNADEIGNCVEIVSSGDFYHPKNAQIFNAIVHLWNSNMAADAITVADQLGAQLPRVGGIPYLHDCVAAPTTVANATWYAKIVAKEAKMRRLAEAGARVTALGYSDADDADATIDQAQQLLFDVNSKRAGETYSTLDMLLQPTLDHIEAAGAAGPGIAGIPTGFSDLDRLLNGLHGGQLIVVAGRPGLGKVRPARTSFVPQRSSTTSRRRSSPWRCPR